MRMKMWCLTIRIKRNDEYRGKKLSKFLIEFLMNNKIAGATVWTGVDGFGKRHKSTTMMEGITINMPIIIEVIDEESKLDKLLPQIRRYVGDKGIVTIKQVDAI
jgi:PII-like signaling protein